MAASCKLGIDRDLANEKLQAIKTAKAIIPGSQTQTEENVIGSTIGRSRIKAQGSTNSAEDR